MQQMVRVTVKNSEVIMSCEKWGVECHWQDGEITVIAFHEKPKQKPFKVEFRTRKLARAWIAQQSMPGVNLVPVRLTP